MFDIKVTGLALLVGRSPRNVLVQEVVSRNRIAGDELCGQWRFLQASHDNIASRGKLAVNEDSTPHTKD